MLVEVVLWVSRCLWGGSKGQGFLGAPRGTSHTRRPRLTLVVVVWCMFSLPCSCSYMRHACKKTRNKQNCELQPALALIISHGRMQSSTSMRRCFSPLFSCWSPPLSSRSCGSASETCSSAPSPSGEVPRLVLRLCPQLIL